MREKEKGKNEEVNSELLRERERVFLEYWLHKASVEGAFLSSFSEWRPIPSMGVMYKIFAKEMANYIA